MFNRELSLVMARQRYIFYFTQRHLVGLGQKRKGLSLYPTYLAALHWHPGPHELWAWPLALNASRFPQTVFFSSSVSSCQLPCFTFCRNDFAHSRQFCPTHEVVCSFLKATKICPFLSHSQFLWSSVSTLCSVSFDGDVHNSLHL